MKDSGHQIYSLSIRPIKSSRKRSWKCENFRVLCICSHCETIRDEKGVWNQMEAYIHKHSEAEFSRSLCRDCLKSEMDAVNKDLPE